MPDTQHVIDAIYNCSGAKELHQFYHASYFSPMKATSLHATRNGYLWGFEGLTYKGAKHHIAGNELAAIQGHLKQC